MTMRAPISDLPLAFDGVSLRVGSIDIGRFCRPNFVPDCEAVSSVVTFQPPTIEHGQIQSAVHCDFLAAGS